MKLQLPETYVFSQLPKQERKRFMDFLIENDVEFQFEPNEKMYVATLKMLKNQPEPSVNFESPKKIEKIENLQENVKNSTLSQQDFEKFYKILQPKNIGCIRAKRMNLQTTLKVIEEIYSYKD